MGFLSALTGGDQVDTAHGVDINKNDFQIQNADQLFGQTQDQYKQAAAQQAGLTNQSNSLLSTLQASANGQGPSLSSAMLKQAQDRNLQQQLAMAQGQRGGNPAAMQRELLRSQSAGAANVANQGVTAGLQEQLQNRTLYANQLNQQQTSVNQMTQQYLQQGMNLRQAQEQALADYNHLNVQQALGIADINAQNQRAQMSAQSGLIGGMIQGAATMGAAGISGSAMRDAAKTMAGSGMGAGGMTAGYGGNNMLGGQDMFNSLGGGQFAPQMGGAMPFGSTSMFGQLGAQSFPIAASQRLAPAPQFIQQQPFGSGRMPE